MNIIAVHILFQILKYECESFKYLLLFVLRTRCDDVVHYWTILDPPSVMEIIGRAFLVRYFWRKDRIYFTIIIIINCWDWDID